MIPELIQQCQGPQAYKGPQESKVRKDQLAQTLLCLDHKVLKEIQARKALRVSQELIQQYPGRRALRETPGTLALMGPLALRAYKALLALRATKVIRAIQVYRGQKAHRVFLEQVQPLRRLRSLLHRMLPLRLVPPHLVHTYQLLVM